MKNIQIFEEAKKVDDVYDELTARMLGFKDALEDLGVNRTLYRAYRNGQETKNEYIDFNEVIWDEDVEPIVEFCKQEGIDRITISSTFYRLTETIWRLTELGCTMEGMVKVNATYTDWRTGERAVRPAFLVRMPQA